MNLICDWWIFCSDWRSELTITVSAIINHFNLIIGVTYPYKGVIFHHQNKAKILLCPQELEGKCGGESAYWNKKTHLRLLHKTVGKNHEIILVKSRIMWFSTDGRFTEPILEAAILNDRGLIRSRFCIKRIESHRRRVGLKSWLTCSNRICCNSFTLL